MAKLDRVLVSDDWESKFNLAVTLALRRLTLDHVPVWAITRK